VKSQNWTARLGSSPIPAVLLAAGLALAGCAEKTLYRWDEYQPQVADHFKGGSPDAEIAVLEEGVQKAQATPGGTSTLPPGYRAQLGYLYGLTGKTDLMLQQFAAEKAAFPESATYMDFLLANARKPGAPK
jgi:hypothetical protein